MDSKRIPRTTPRFSATFDEFTLSEIRRAAATGIYDIRGAGAKRRVPHFDDLLVLGASVSRYPLEGYRERCDTAVTLGTRHAALEASHPAGGSLPRRDLVAAVWGLLRGDSPRRHG